MKGHTIVVLALALLTALGGATRPVLVQGNAQLGNAPLTHVGVAVRDIDAAVRNYAAVMGIAAPQVRSIGIDLPDGSKADTKIAFVMLPNFVIELDQPMSNKGPIYDHLQKYGMSINHIGFSVPEGLDGIRSGLEQKGGKWVGGAAKGAKYAYVDFHSQIGTTIQVEQQAPPPAPTASGAASGSSLPPLGTLAVRHLGFGMSDADVVIKAFTDILGIPMPAKIGEYRDSQYPPESPWNKQAYLRLTSFNQSNNLGIELIASVGGPTPWSDYVQRQKGTAPQHIAIGVGDMMDEMIQALQMKGGKWTNGKPGGGYAYLDFMDKLGVVFEITGKSKMGAAAAAK